MAASGRSSVTLLCVCTVVVVLLLLADGTAALEHQGERETAISGATKGFYLRGNLVIPTETSTEESEESIDSFIRRELTDGYDSDPATANCDQYSSAGCPP